MTAAVLDLGTVASGGKVALARALSALEARPDAADVANLLDAAWRTPLGHVLGLTGPPGVGKSSLTNSLIQTWRADSRRVAVIAVDPSSRVTGGALLGDRIRLATDPEDEGVFVRSMAARQKLGGLAELTFPAMVLMRALFDIVIIETVGVGQSETDVANASDTVVFCVQPGSGDSVQFMKAGIMEVPDITIVTKADMGAIAGRAKADVRGALSLSDGRDDGWEPPVLLVSSASGQGIDKLVAAIDAHAAHMGSEGLLKRRQAQGKAWLEDWIATRYGSEGLRLTAALSLPALSPFATAGWIADRLSVSLR